MKKLFLLITVSILWSLTSLSQEKLNINIQKSTIKWIGEYTFYFGGHNGFINFKEGYFIKQNTVITGGEFIINLTLKGITKPINFRAEFNYQEKELQTRFKIDRKRWNVNYESKFKDGAISDAIGFEVSIKL